MLQFTSIVGYTSRGPTYIESFFTIFGQCINLLNCNRECSHSVFHVVDLKEFAHVHLLNIIKGTKESLFKHKQSKNNRKLYSLVLFCPNNKKYNQVLKSSVSPVNSES